MTKRLILPISAILGEVKVTDRVRMSARMRLRIITLVAGMFGALAASGQSLPSLFPFPDATGLLETYNAGNQPIDLTGPFFQSLGTKRTELRVVPPPGAELEHFGAGGQAAVRTHAGAGPILRGLAARAPYFHNGSADSLRDVIEFYDMRFNIGFTPEEKKDLIAFLNAL